jgi:hypothetical protein
MQSQDPHNNGCLPCVATEECADSGNAPKIYKVGPFGKIRDPGMGPFNQSEPVRNKTALQNQIRMLKEEVRGMGWEMHYETLYSSCEGGMMVFSPAFE